MTITVFTKVMEHAKHAPLFQWTVFVDVIPVPRTKQLSSLTELDRTTK